MTAGNKLYGNRGSKLCGSEEGPSHGGWSKKKFVS